MKMIIKVIIGGLGILVIVVTVLLIYHIRSNSVLEDIDYSNYPYITLPVFKTDGDISVEETLVNRRSRRNFQDKTISLEQLSQILWAAYGITLSIPNEADLRGGFRTTPSAGALYPLEVYVVIGNVEDIEPGLYKYIAQGHKIVRLIDGDIRDEFSEATLGQRMIKDAPVSIFYSAVFRRTTDRYGRRGNNYVYIELGHSAQNVYLQVEALGLGTVAVGAFNDSEVSRVMQLPPEEEPLYIMPVGYIVR